MYDEIKLLQDSFLRTWAIYITWYTWFFGTVVAYTLLLTQDHTKIQRHLLIAFVIFMELFMVMGFFAAHGMHRYRNEIWRRARQLLGTSAEAADGIFATSISKVATINIMFRHLVGAGLWLFLAIDYPK